MKDLIYFNILTPYLYEKFMNQLRTKEALGYIVSIKPFNTYGYCGMQNIIESNSYTPEFCAERVRNLYKEIYQTIKNITEEEFQMQAKDLFNALDEKDKDLFDVFERNWDKIKKNTYDFDKDERKKEN